MDFLTKLVDADKLGGWVRAGVASGLGIALSKWPALATYLDPVTQAAIGTAISGIVVGAWSHFAKSQVGA